MQEVNGWTKDCLSKWPSFQNISFQIDIEEWMINHEDISINIFLTNFTNVHIFSKDL